MRAVGFECSGEEFIFVVVEGSQSKPSLVARETRKAPGDSARPEQLQWLRREVHAILDKHQPEAVG